MSRTIFHGCKEKSKAPEAVRHTDESKSRLSGEPHARTDELGDLLAGKALARVGFTPAPDSRSMGSVTLSLSRSPVDPVLGRTEAMSGLLQMQASK